MELLFRGFGPSSYLQFERYLVLELHTHGDRLDRRGYGAGRSCLIKMAFLSVIPWTISLLHVQDRTLVTVSSIQQSHSSGHRQQPRHDAVDEHINANRPAFSTDPN